MTKTATKTKAAKKTTTKKAAAAKTTAKKKTAKKSPKAKTTKKTKPAPQEELVVEIDRRETGDRRDPVAKAEVPVERRKVARRRQIDPTTCERDYSDHEIEFMQAMDAYKRSSGRMFPTCSEILEVVRSLGYSRPGDELLNESNTDVSDVEDEENEGFAATDAGDDSDFDAE